MGRDKRIHNSYNLFTYRHHLHVLIFARTGAVHVVSERCSMLAYISKDSLASFIRNVSFHPTVTELKVDNNNPHPSPKKITSQPNINTLSPTLRAYCECYSQNKFSSSLCYSFVIFLPFLSIKSIHSRIISQTSVSWILHREKRIWIKYDF